jgi:hypothetical protein
MSVEMLDVECSDQLENIAVIVCQMTVDGDMVTAEWKSCTFFSRVSRKGLSPSFSPLSLVSPKLDLHIGGMIENSINERVCPQKV